MHEHNQTHTKHTSSLVWWVVKGGFLIAQVTVLCALLDGLLFDPDAPTGALVILFAVLSYVNMLHFKATKNSGGRVWFDNLFFKLAPNHVTPLGYVSVIPLHELAGHPASHLIVTQQFPFFMLVDESHGVDVKKELEKD